MFEKVKFVRRVDDGFVEEALEFLKAGGEVIYVGYTEDGDLIGLKDEIEQYSKLTKQDSDHQFSNSSSPYQAFVSFCENGGIICCHRKKRYDIHGPNDRVELHSGPSYTLFRAARDIETDAENLTFTDLYDSYIRAGYHLYPFNYQINLGLITWHERLPSLLGELMADKNEMVVQIVRFEGEDQSKVIEIEEYGRCPLFRTYEQVLNRLKDLNICKSPTNEKGTSIKELFDMECCRLALVNAFTYNDYSLSMPIIHFYSDRIEIISYGGLPPEQTAEKVFSGFVIYRDELLSRIFVSLGYNRWFAEGPITIAKRYGQEAFEFHDKRVKVTLPFNSSIA